MAEINQNGAVHLNQRAEVVKKLSPVAMAWRATSWLIKNWQVIPASANQSKLRPCLTTKCGHKISSPVPMAKPIMTTPTPSAFCHGRGGGRSRTFSGGEGLP